MSIALIDNQPVYFVLDGTNPEDLPANNGEYDFKIPVSRGSGDRTYCQIRIAPVAGSPNIITDSAFATTTYWGTTGSGLINTGNATIGDGTTGSIYKNLTTSITVGEIYQLQINVADLFGTAYVYNGTTLIATINSLGIQTVSFEAVNTTIFIKIIDSESYIQIYNVDLFALPTNFAVAILNTDYEPIEILHYDVDTDNFKIKGDRLTFFIDWDALGLDAGCYYIGLTDPEQNQCNQYGIYNPTFDLGGEPDGSTTILGWQASYIGKVEFQPSMPLAEIKSDIGEANYIINTRRKLCANKTYNIDVHAYSDATGANLGLICGGVVTATQSVTSTPAIFSFSLTTTTDDYLRIVCDNTLGGISRLTLNVTEVELALASETDWYFEYKTLHPYKYIALNEIDFKVVGLFNNEDGLGFIFNGSDFFPQLRVHSKFKNRKYYGERIANENDEGLKRIDYAQRRKAKFFGIQLQPNYILDFLALAQDADHFYVDETEWFVENEEPNIKFSDELDNFGDVELELSKPQQLVRNINSGTISAPPIAGILADPSDTEVSLSEPATGDLIEAR